MSKHNFELQLESIKGKKSWRGSQTELSARFRLATFTEDYGWPERRLKRLSSMLSINLEQQENKLGPTADFKKKILH